MSLLLFLAGCATTSQHFSDRAVLWRDPDARAVAQSAPQSAGIQWTGLRDAVLFPADRVLSLDYGEESWNVNALDEVPDSSWWVDIRRSDDTHGKPRVLGAEAMTRGLFGKDLGPVLPLTIVKGKAIGSTPGLVVIDARGTKYLLKLDPPGWLGLNTSTEVVATRLAWAAGWLVPAEKIVDVDPTFLVLDPKAKTKNADGDDVPLTAKMVVDLLKRTPREQDGTLRVCASVWIEGKNLGSWAYTGRRRDDPNDRVPHQNRRDVRAFGVFASWVNDIDTMENNTMDAYVGKPGQGHILHYQQDVGGSFGQFAAVPAEVWMGEETFFMPRRILVSTLTFGFTSRTWEGELKEHHREQLMHEYPQLGYFADKGFNPRAWHPVLDNPAFVRQTLRDRYWGAKRLAAFTADEVRAAVELGHYPKATEDHLFQILWGRREAILRAFFSDVAALDYFQIDAGRLCFDDLWMDAGLGETPDYMANLDGKHELAVSDRCVELRTNSGYHVVAFSVGGSASRQRHTVQVHVVADARGARVVGVRR
jgi:hypothetical protein